VLLEQKDIEFVLTESLAPESLGKGTLYITSKQVYWLHAANAELGFALNYPFILMHAISREEERPCIYCQLDLPSAGDDEVVPEARFIPDDAVWLEDMYAALCSGAENNPDPGGEDDEGAGDFFFNREEVQAGVVQNGMQNMDLDEGDDDDDVEDEN
jgi:nucleotide-sensitive chloride channel 1A